jgi:shikimate 5-dehydrogenase
VGTASNAEESPLRDDYAFPSSGLVYDLVYNPQQTQLMTQAARAGCRTIGGLEMLVAQAQAQFEWWTGGRPASRVMRDAALARLQSTAGERAARAEGPK